MKIIDVEYSNNKIIYKLQSFFHNFILVQNFGHEQKTNKIISSINIFRIKKGKPVGIKNINKFRNIIEQILREKNIDVLILEDPNNFEFEGYKTYLKGPLTIFEKSIV